MRMLVSFGIWGIGKGPGHLDRLGQRGFLEVMDLAHGCGKGDFCVLGEESQQRLDLDCGTHLDSNSVPLRSIC